MNSEESSWREAAKGMTEIGGATLLFALWHSLFCSLPAKRYLTPQLEKYSVSYRLFFIVQSAITFGALLGLVFSRPRRTVYQFKGILKAACWLIQAACAVVCVWGFLSIGPRRFLLGQSEVEPDAQGPNLKTRGYLEVTGPFRWSRHPIEWGPMLMLFSTPHLKTNWLAFNILGVIYSVLGALHEEKRLDEKAPKAHERYKKQVGFWFGRAS